MYKLNFKTITVKIHLSEFNVEGDHTINKLVTKIIDKTNSSINNTIKRHNRFNDYKVDVDGITSETFPNNT